MLRDLKSGRLTGTLLCRQERHEVVRHLSAEGASAPEIAQVLGLSERTIARDRRALQDEGAIHHDPALAGRMAGRLVAEAESCVQRIRRAGRDSGASPAVRIEAERAVFEILDRLTARLQSLGYLPSAATQVHTTLAIDQSSAADLDAIAAEAERLKRIVATVEPKLLESGERKERGR